MDRRTRDEFDRIRGNYIARWDQVERSINGLLATFFLVHVDRRFLLQAGLLAELNNEARIRLFGHVLAAVGLDDEFKDLPKLLSAANTRRNVFAHSMGPFLVENAPEPTVMYYSLRRGKEREVKMPVATLFDELDRLREIFLRLYGYHDQFKPPSDGDSA
jgi:hypothetical protein